MVMGRFHRLGRKFFCGSAGLLLGWTGTGMLAAQTSEPGVAPNRAPVQRNYLNKNVIQLPIQITEESRSRIQEIQLYMKDTPSAPWTLRDRVGSAAKAFSWEVPKDGEYWFAMMTVDKQGRCYPGDLRNESPGLIVVIDTQKPQLEVTNLGNTPDGHLIQFEARDGNLDATRTQLAYQGGDRKFRTLEPLPNRVNVYCIPPQAVYTGLVRVTAEDLAGNLTQQEVNLNQLPAGKAGPVNPPIVIEMPPPRGDLRMPIGPEPDALSAIPGGVLDVKPGVHEKPAVGSGRPDGTEGPHWQVEHKVDSPASPVPPKDTLKRQFVNNTKVSVDFQIENAGPNGAGKVEVWITRDRAKSWQKLSAEAPRNNQLEIQFPGEGIFGVTLVAANTRGVAGPAPAAGEAPDWWVEVDTTKPVLNLTKVEPITEAGKTSVHIAWTALDKNFGDAPVELFYGNSSKGPWQSIAKGLNAEGQHRWLPPTEAGAKAYLRVVAHDVASNESGITTKETVSLEAPPPPRAVIRGISTPPQFAPPAMQPPRTFEIVQPPPIR